MTLHLSLYPYKREKIRAVIIHKVYNHLPRLTPPYAPSHAPFGQIFREELARNDGEVSTSGFKNVQKEVSF